MVMNKEDRDKNAYFEAKKKVLKLKWFYINLCVYIVVIGFIVWNFMVIEENEYTEGITFLNYSTIVVWGIFIIIHALLTFKGYVVFNKNWEQKKIDAYMKNDGQRWE